MAATAVPPPVEGRECGSCNVCCVVLTITDPALTKPQGVRCSNATADNRCGIYDRRPQTCRTFLCGWRQLRWVKQGLRPDVSGVLIRPLSQLVDGHSRLTLVVTFLSEAGLEADGTAETLAAAVAAGVPLFMEVVGEPGQPYATARVDGILSGSVQRRDKGEMVGLLHAMWQQAQAQAARRMAPAASSRATP